MKQPKKKANKEVPYVVNVDSAGPPRWADYCALSFSQDAFTLRLATANKGDKKISAHTVIVMSPRSGKQLRVLLDQAIAGHEKLCGAINEKQ